MAPTTTSVAVRVEHVDGRGADRIVDLHCSEATVADVIAAIEADWLAGDGSIATERADVVKIDGVVLARDQLAQPAAEVLRAGSTIVVGRADRHGGMEPRSAGWSGAQHDVVEVAVVAGHDAGAVTALPCGHYRFGGSAGWFLAVESGHRALGVPAPWHEAGPTLEVIGDDTPGGPVLALSAAVDPQPGTVGFVHRPPRPSAPDEVEPIAHTAAPAAVTDPAPLSWAALLGPIPIAVVMAVFFRPIFAIFAAMGPLVALGRWYEGRRRHRRATDTRTREVARLRADLRAAIADRAETEARRRWHQHPHVAELWRRARVHSARLWERRPGSPDHLAATIGVGPIEFLPPFEGRPDPEIHDGFDRATIVRPVPHVLDLASNTGLGLHGQRDEVLAVARSVVMQLATLHGPADLRIGVIAPEASGEAWDWLKWLPHVDPALVAHSAAPLVDLFVPAPATGLSRTWQPEVGVGATTLLVVDDPTADVAALHRRAAAAGQWLRVIALAAAPTALPAACTALVGLHGHDRALVSAPQVGTGATPVTPTGISAATATAWALRLAPMRDPECTEFEHKHGEHAPNLLRLLGLVDAESLERSWANRPADAPPLATVGTVADRAFTIDLDRDGPHALVAGTTGSGKSELLRTMVLALAADCPPQHLNFVLIDFKGGGAFDACAGLPHVAGVITDLDVGVVARAINSLRAELQRREALFRALGVSDHREAVRVDREPIPRLVIVIDEFAALATDHSDLLTSIVDLAARGRSLGMHLVLATQRPNGVVDQKIRANTNLRIALRVQDAFDSQDVVGVPDAARIDRHSPGRAVVSVGGDVPIDVQVAFSGQVDRRELRCSVGPFTLFGLAGRRDLLPENEPRDASPPGPRLGSAPTVLRVATELITDAAARSPSVTRPLWPDPLPERFDWIDLGTRLLGSQAAGPGLALGLVDLPDHQAQLPWFWNPDDGALAMYGSSARAAGRLLVAIGASLASSTAPDDAHVYVIDGDSGHASPLAGLAHVGAYVSGSEPDRVERTVHLVERVLEQRRARTGGDEPRVLVMIDNIASVLDCHDDLAAMALADRIGALARDGAPRRVHLVVTARTPRDLTHRLAQQIPFRLVGELADPAGYLTLGLKSTDVTVLPYQRVIDLSTRRTVQLVDPPELGDLAMTRVSDPARAPVPVPPFPAVVDPSRLPWGRCDETGLHVPLGLDAGEVRVASLHLRPGGHGLVVGPAGSGRTSTLCLVADRLGPAAIELCWIGGPPTALRDSQNHARPAETPHRLAALAETTRPTLVLIDDADRLGSEFDEALSELAAVRNPNVYLLASTTAEHARSLRSNVAALRSDRTGVVLGAITSDGDVFKVARTRLDGLGVVPGRGHLVDRGRVIGLQIAHVHTDHPNEGPTSTAPRHVPDEPEAESSTARPREA